MTDFNHRSTDKRPSGDNIQKSILFGNFSVPAYSIPTFPNNTVNGSTTITHGLGYIPAWDVYILQRQPSTPLTGFPSRWYITTRFQTIFTYTNAGTINYIIYVIMDEQKLHIFWTINNFEATTFSSEAIPVKYFIFQQGATV